MTDNTNNTQDKLLQVQVLREEMYLKLDEQKLINLKNEPTSKRIEHARRNIEVLTKLLYARGEYSSKDNKEEISKSIQGNIKVMDEVSKIK